jgi:hypothetical protein
MSGSHGGRAYIERYGPGATTSSVLPFGDLKWPGQVAVDAAVLANAANSGVNVSNIGDHPTKREARRGTARRASLCAERR